MRTLKDRYKIEYKMQFKMINQLIDRCKYYNNPERADVKDTTKIIDSFFGNLPFVIVKVWDSRISRLLDSLEFNENTKKYIELYLSLWRDYDNVEFKFDNLNVLKEYLLSGEHTNVHCIAGYDLFFIISRLYDTNISVQEYQKSVIKLSNIFNNIDISIKQILEDGLRSEIVHDWYNHVTNLYNINDALNTYNVLASALDSFPEQQNVNKPVLSCSLITETNHALYNNRKLGYLYNVCESTFYGADYEDNQSTYLNLEYSRNLLTGYSVSGYDILNIDYTQPIFFSSFSRAPLIHNILKNTKKGTYNEVLLLSSEKPAGVFIIDKYTDTQYNRFKAECNKLNLPGFIIGDTIKRV